MWWEKEKNQQTLVSVGPTFGDEFTLLLMPIAIFSFLHTTPEALGQVGEIPLFPPKSQSRCLAYRDVRICWTCWGLRANVK